MIRVRGYECKYGECKNPTTAEGLMCRKHWDMVPGAVKAHYMSALKQAHLAVKAKEILANRRLENEE